MDLDYPILSDTDGSVAKAYGIHNGRFSNRVTFITGADGKILEIIKKVNTSSHGKDVAALLKKLGVAEK